MAVPERIPHLDVTPEQTAEFWKTWDIREPAALGSALRDDFTDESDRDVFVNLDMVWETIHSYFPALVKTVEPLIPPEAPDVSGDTT